MKKLRALLVDDEHAALQTLAGMLARFCPQVSVVGRCETIEAAYAAIKELEPDVVFLDIEMPPSGRGFDLLRMFSAPSFGVIFTTAYPNYAIEAINDVQPWGYLVKPCRISVLVKTVNGAYDRVHRRSQSQLFDREQSLLIPHRRKGKLVIPIRDILYCHADQRTTDIYFLREGEKLKKVTSSESLKSLLAQLPSKAFCRTHHAYIVNLAHIIRYRREGRNGIIYFPHDCEALISVLKMKNFEQAFRVWLQGDR